MSPSFTEKLNKKHSLSDTQSGGLQKVKTGTNQILKLFPS